MVSVSTLDRPVAETPPKANLFAEPTSSPHVLDFGIISPPFLAALTGSGAQPAALGPRWLLPADYQWVDASGRRRIPLPLCEFAAYKAALAYEKESVIKRNLGDATHFAFFDSAPDQAGDSQAFGCLDDGLAFIVIRGSENSNADWRINLEDGLTDTMLQPDAKLRAHLKSRHGPGVERVLDAVAAHPGRHLGFAIAWAVIEDKVVRYLATLPVGTPVILTGHSQGGAVAKLAAADLAGRGHDIAAVVTFGAPPAGNTAFVAAYTTAGLDQRTVRFEATGDSVPRIMRRWYYRLHQTAREAALSMMRQPTVAASLLAFTPVGASWVFDSQPVLSLGELKSAIRAAKDAAVEKLKRIADEQQKIADAKTKVEPAAKPGVDAGKDGASAKSDAPPKPDKGTTSTGDPRIFWLIISAIVVAVIVFGVWLFVRHKLASHAIAERYALFLSTLSYQKIRALRAADPAPDAERLTAANVDLDHYLTFIRGDYGPGASYVRDAKLAELPVRLQPDIDFGTYLADPRNMV